MRRGSLVVRGRDLGLGFGLRYLEAVRARALASRRRTVPAARAPLCTLVTEEEDAAVAPFPCRSF